MFSSRSSKDSPWLNTLGTSFSLPTCPPVVLPVLEREVLYHAVPPDLIIAEGSTLALAEPNRDVSSTHRGAGKREAGTQIG